MRKLIAVFFILLAVPAFAQQERECRGKKPFDLGDGAYGCLQELGTTAITTTTTRDDNASSKSRRNTAGRITVLMFGDYSDSRSVISSRAKKVCRAFLADFNAENPNLRPHRIVIDLIWPRVENPGTFVPKDQAKVAVQPSFSSGRCVGVKFFGR